MKQILGQLGSISISCLLVASILGIPRTVWAANHLLQEAIQHYENFKYEESLNLLQQSLQYQDSNAQEKITIHIYLGLVHFTLGDVETAKHEFGKALLLDDQVKLPVDTSPKISSSFEKIRQSILTSAPPVKQAPKGKTQTQRPKDTSNPPEHLVSQLAEPKEPQTATEPPERTSITLSDTRVRPKAKKRIWTWVLAGVGGAALVTGGVFGGLVLRTKSDFDNTPYASEAAKLKDTYESRKLTANILFGAGGAILATAVVLFFLEGGGQSTQPGREPGLSLCPTPLGVDLSFQF